MAGYLNGELDWKPTAAELEQIRVSLRLWSALRKAYPPPPPDPEGSAWLTEFSLSGVMSFSGLIEHYIFVDLAGRDLEHRFRECLYCGRWFYAHRDDQRFCHGGKCRKKHEKCEEFRNDKAEAMMERRKIPVDTKLLGERREIPEHSFRVRPMCAGHLDPSESR